MTHIDIVEFHLLHHVLLLFVFAFLMFIRQNMLKMSNLKKN